MEKIHENMCKQVCFYVFIQETSKHVLMYFLQLVLTFIPVVVSLLFKDCNKTLTQCLCM